jgi:hypothetical protein
MVMMSTTYFNLIWRAIKSRHSFFVLKQEFEARSIISRLSNIWSRLRYMHLPVKHYPTTFVFLLVVLRYSGRGGLKESENYVRFFFLGLSVLQTDRCEWTGWESSQVWGGSKAGTMQSRRLERECLSTPPPPSPLRLAPGCIGQAAQ